MLGAELKIPADAKGIVLFVHGSGSSRHNPRNQYVAQVIRAAGVATLLFDLLTQDEEISEASTHHLRFNIELRAAHLRHVTHWVQNNNATKNLLPGYFGSSTGAAAALIVAAELGSAINAIVTRGGRPDLAPQALAHVTTPTLLIVGGHDEMVLQLNEEAFEQMQCQKEIAIISGATHLFEEAGALEEVAKLAAHWFHHYLQPQD